MVVFTFNLGELHLEFFSLFGFTVFWNLLMSSLIRPGGYLHFIQSMCECK